jgi:hypothetical protein
MTDEEADYWDEYFTKNPPTVSGDGKSGFFARHKASRMVAPDYRAADPTVSISGNGEKGG